MFNIKGSGFNTDEFPQPIPKGEASWKRSYAVYGWITTVLSILSF